MKSSPLVVSGAVAVLAAACSERHPALEARFPEAAAHVSRTSAQLAPALDDGAGAQPGFTLPRDASAPVRLTLPGVSVEITERQLEGEAQRVGHLVSYARRDGRAWWAALPQGLEELVERFEADDGPVARWVVRGATLRQLDDAVMVEDERGLGRVRVTAPLAWGADGASGRAWLRVEGDELVLYTDLRGHVLVDPLWSVTSSLTTNLTNASVTALTDGRLFVYGGDETNSGATSALPRIYDPWAGTWSTLPAHSRPRNGHTATLLRDGRVLLVGGVNAAGTTVATAELFNPVDNTFTLTGSLQTARDHHTATLLADGRVLVSGGKNAGGALPSAELFNPSTGMFTTTGPLNQARTSHAAVRLQDGSVLAIAGTAPLASPTTLASCERFNPGTGSWTTVGSLTTGRVDFAATVLHGGQVLVTGGTSSTGAYLASSERFDPTANTWSATGPLTVARRLPVTALLPSGKVLAVGGASAAGSPLASADVYDPAAGTWSASGAMQRSRLSASGGLLPNGKALIIAGVSDGGITNTTEVVDVAFDQSTLTATGSLSTARRDGAVITLTDGRVLAIGGLNSAGTTLATCELYSPTTGTWAATGSMSTARAFFGAALLANGKVLVAGGSNGTTALASAELYDPATGTWSATGSMGYARQRLSLTATPSGPAIAFGGFNGTTVLDRVERYLPSRGTWMEIAIGGPLARWGMGTAQLADGRVVYAGGFTDAAGTTANNLVFVCGVDGTCSQTSNLGVSGRALLSASLLPNGKVLLAGGTDGSGPTAAAWLFDTAATSILPPPTLIPGGGLGQTMGIVRSDATSTVLPNGKVLIVGGRDAANAPIANTTLFDPARGTFEPGPSLGTARAAARLAVLATGKVLIIGGATATGATASVELYDEGRAAALAATPTITPTTLSAQPNTALTFAGTLFEGLSEGGRGAVDFFSSATPVVQLRAAESDRRYRVGLSAFSPTSVTTTALPPPAGLYWVSVTSGGAQSVERPLSLFPPLVLSPTSASVPPRGAQAFSGDGGVGGRAFSFATNASGGTLDATTGSYTAGTTASVTDVVRFTDDQGRSVTANVSVGPGVTGSPGTVTLPPRGTQTFSATGGSGTGFRWSMFANNSGAAITDGGSYTAGAAGSTTDTARVTDSLGNTANVTITVSAGVTSAPASATLAPRASQAFTASGGSGAGYAWTLTTNGSGGTVSSGGAYVAGTTGSSTDVLRVTDSLGNFVSVSVNVTAGVTLSPAAPSTPPRGTLAFTAAGGSATGYTFSLPVSASGGTITAAGAYTAGSTEGVDTVRVVDSLGNVATTQVTVTSRLSITPGSGTVAPRTTLTFSATGGSGTGFTWSLATNGSGATFTPSTATYRAGAMGNAMDVVQVVDSLGNTATVTLTTSGGVSISGGSGVISPRGSAPFSATGGSGTGYSWALSTNASGGTIGATTGQYVAGATGSVVDVVEVTDSLGNTSSVQVTVGPAITITPNPAIVAPGSSQLLSATGGSGVGFQWSVTSVPANGTINQNTGEYSALNRPGTQDTVRVTDSLGNEATATVVISSGVTLTPMTVTLHPRERQTFSASGGSGTGYTYRIVTAGSLGSTIDSATGVYTAGTTGGVTDLIEVRDSNDLPAQATVSLLPALAFEPATASVAPLGTVPFTVTGGGSSRTFSFSSNRSGASIDDGGVYTAGPMGGATDVLVVTDEFGATASVNIAVGAELTIKNTTAPLAPGGTFTFQAAGGGGAYAWSLEPNRSGGSIDARTGEYTAGGTTDVSDVVKVTDSVGATATTEVQVVATGGTITRPPYTQQPPVSGWSCGCGATPGDLGLLSLAGLALLSRRRRRAGRAAGARHAGNLALLVVILALPAFAAAKKKPAPRPKPAPAQPTPPPEPPPAVVTPPPAAEVTPPPAPVKPGKRSLAVVDVGISVPDEKLDGTAFTEMMTSSVEGSGQFKVISARDISTMLGLERQRQLLGCSEDSGCMAEIASALGSDFVLAGNIGKVGGTYLVTVKMVEGARSRVVGRGSLQTQQAEALLGAVWTATQQALDSYGAQLAPPDAAAWSARPKQEPPAAVTASLSSLPNYFGITLLAVGGLQVLSDAGKRGSIGAEVDLTFRRGRFDLGAGVIIGPNIGVRLTAAWAIIDTRFRLSLGVRGAGYPGANIVGTAPAPLLFGGGLAVIGELAFNPYLGVTAIGAGEIYPVAGQLPVVAVLGSVGVTARF